jgi:hypothetical protein
VISFADREQWLAGSDALANQARQRRRVGGWPAALAGPVRTYIKNQEMTDKQLDQLHLKLETS